VARRGEDAPPLAAAPRILGGRRYDGMPSFPRFLFRVKDRQIEEEARQMVLSLGIGDVEIRRDDTIKDAWLEDNEALKTTYGLEDIQEYLERLTSRR
jgi:hypothetical protein